MHAVQLLLLHSTILVLITMGLSCPKGGYNNNQTQFGEECMYRCHCLDDEQCDSNTGECLRGCAAGWMGPGCQYGDIAYNKATWQNTRRFGSSDPAKAVDGDSSTCSETTWLSDPWWRVDLGVMYRISGLIIHSGETGALKGFEVRIGNVSSDSPSMYPRTCFKHNITDELDVVIHAVCAFEQVAQHLMIVVSGKQTRINLCDVRVYGGRSLAYRRNATQASEASGGQALRALDGGILTWYNAGTCTHTLEQAFPWWRVDLERVYDIMTMEIYNRHECCAERLSGCVVSFAVNDSYTLVYKYPDTTPSEKTEVTNISSDVARFIKIGLPVETNTALTLCEVIIYGDCPDNFCGWSCKSTCFCAGPIDKRNKIDGICQRGCADNWTGSKCSLCYIGRNDICETLCGKCLQGSLCNASDRTCVEGCQQGWWNPSCNSTCNKCKENTTCTQMEGFCSECPTGKWGHFCEVDCKDCMEATGCNVTNGICLEGCRPGRFGVKCDQQCAKCAMDGSCSRNTGKCIYGCLPGWTNDNCSIVCPFRWFGQNCSQQCGHCVNDSSCHHANGTCIDGCSPGYNGSLCNTECHSGYFGFHCDQRCGHCADDSTCHHVGGTCLKGCAPGYTGTICNTECRNSYYGYNCSEECGYCLNDTVCHHVNGSCDMGCEPGFTGNTCKIDCPYGTYGVNCSIACGHCADNLTCHHINGTCMNGCSPGYNDTMCNAECPNGLYGYNCSEECGNCYYRTVCEHINGACEMGCEPGFTGYSCKEVSKAEQKNNAYIGGAVGGAVVLILIAIGLVLWRRRRSSENQHQKRIPAIKKKTSDDILNTYENVSSFNQDVMMDIQKPASNFTLGAHENKEQVKFTTIEKAHQNQQELELVAKGEDVHFSPTLDNVDYIPSDEQSEKKMYDDRGIYYNLEERRILVENLEDYVKKTVYLSTDCEQEYQRLVSGPQYDMNIALKPSNRPKNRYKGIYAYDNTRVVLDSLPQEPDSDYVNACFIKGYKRDKAYIAAQGPTTTIVNDFWRMIWQYNISTVVMLTGLTEQGKHKCHQYWPSEGSMEFGTLLVEIVDEEIYTEYTVRFLKVNKKGFTTQKMVTQFHFTAWPDRDVPESPAALVQFWNKVRNTGAPTTNSPTLVHCSAGIGRTGTYIALDYLYDEGQAGGSISVFDCINGLRRQRVGMVQNAEQYVYLHEVLVEAILLSGKRVDGNDFPKYYQQMREIDQTNKQTRLRVEYETLQRDEQSLPDKATSKTTKDPVYEKAYEYECGRLPENKMKNRYGNIIPSRRYRPFLSSYIPGRNDYINAVTLPTLRNKNGLILTQMPLPDTVVDFWTLAFEYEVHTLVMMNEDNMPVEKIGVYWPKEDEVSQFGPFTVKKVSETRTGTHVQRVLHVSREGRESILNVKQFACSVWKSGNANPESCRQFLSFMEEVDTWQRRSENRPMIVHCLNGAEQSGLFCVLWCVLERVKADREVAIRSVVRQMCSRRQQIIPNFEQYQFCHDIILEYLTNFVTYTNL